METQATRMAALFIGHGSPMNTLELNDFTRAWRALGQMMPRRHAILVVSAHWFIGSTAVTAMARPRTSHDFYGFPREQHGRQLGCKKLGRCFKVDSGHCFGCPAQRLESRL